METFATIATPCRSGAVAIEYMQGMFAASGATPRLRLLTREGDSILPRARHVLAQMFMSDPSNGDVLVWVDDDMAFTGYDLLRLVQRAKLLSTVNPMYVLAAQCPSRGGGPTVDWGDGEATGVAGLVDMRAARHVGLGFTATSRALFGALGDRAFGPGTEQEGEGFVGEDVALCRRATAVGGLVVCDTSLDVGHVGRYVYRKEPGNENMR